MTLLIIVGLDHWARPDRSKPRSPMGILIAYVIVTVVFLLVLVVVWRPLTSAALTIGIVGSVLCASLAKHRFLREPLVFADFSLLSQVYSHPRLYIGYIGYGRFSAAFGAVAAVVIAMIVLEPALTARFDDRAAMLWGFTAVMAGIAALIAYCAPLNRLIESRERPFTPDAWRDVSRYGLLATLLFHRARHRSLDRRNIPLIPPKHRLPTRWRSPLPPIPDIIMIQNESFVDPRQVPGTRAIDLPGYDALVAEAIQAGRLETGIWGANTMRSEFAALTGVANAALDTRRFNPYRMARSVRSPSLATMLAEQGYHTTCLHPHELTFFDRHFVVPNLGFDTFVGEGGFQKTDRHGPYVSDPAVARAILKLIDGDDLLPSFVFAITMENHGPWGAGRFKARLDAPTDPVDQYYRHLASADRMIDILRQGLRQRARPAVLCFFGDHVPILMDRLTPVPSPSWETDYVIWRSDQMGLGRDTPMSVEGLAGATLAAAGYAPAPPPSPGEKDPIGDADISATAS